MGLMLQPSDLAEKFRMSGARIPDLLAQLRDSVQDWRAKHSRLWSQDGSTRGSPALAVSNAQQPSCRKPRLAMRSNAP